MKAEESSPKTIPSHPLGIKPLGNLYLSKSTNARLKAGSIQRLPDELLMVMLEALDEKGLLNLGATCRFLYAFCRSDELWKPLFLQSHMESLRPVTWRGSWRRSLLRLSPEKESLVCCKEVFSDVLHRPFACTYIDLTQCADIPERNQIKRLDNMTFEEFSESWSGTPFILTKPIRQWPAFSKWNIEFLRDKYPGIDFRAEAVDWPFSVYCDYLCNNSDESPLYLFDCKFAENMGITVGRGSQDEYYEPDCFGLDLFEVLGNQRPAHRWLIVGPKRSGSTFHKDPNATSAWNAVLQGAKYWIMFPPAANIPGVFVSSDLSEVTSPLSIAEWLLEFHAEARSLPGCLEGVCNAGEVLHVPSGWWHLVVNLEDGIAITQNFVPRSHLTSVMEFLRDKPDQVSGFDDKITDPYGLFLQRLKDKYPEETKVALQKLEAKRRKRKWDNFSESEKTEGQFSNVSGFSFGFGGADIDTE